MTGRSSEKLDGKYDAALARPITVQTFAHQVASSAKRWRESGSRMIGSPFRIDPPGNCHQMKDFQSVSGSCALGRMVQVDHTARAQGQPQRKLQFVRTGQSVSSATSPLPNRSLEWTSTGWPRYAHCSSSASRGQPVAATQLKR
jgi:hypothetical protein